VLNINLVSPLVHALAGNETPTAAVCELPSDRRRLFNIEIQHPRISLNGRKPSIATPSAQSSIPYPHLAIRISHLEFACLRAPSPLPPQVTSSAHAHNRAASAQASAQQSTNHHRPNFQRSSRAHTAVQPPWYYSTHVLSITILGHAEILLPAGSGQSGKSVHPT
jgi:hypothetical protein